MKVDLKETGCEAVNYIYLAQDGVRWCYIVNRAIKLTFV